jgi:hypothetical protein
MNEVEAERIAEKMAVSFSDTVLDPNRGKDALTAGVDGRPAEGKSSKSRDRVGSVQVGEVAARPHGKLPYGFARHYDVVGGKRRLVKQTIDEQQAAVIREAARRVLDGDAPYAIARDFNARGIPAPRGGSWDLTRVKRIVTSPTVAGLRVHRGHVVGPGEWPAILDQTTWTGCQARLTDPARRTSHDDPQVKYLLTGIAMCGICSTGLKTVKNRGNRTYSCPTCFKVGIKVDTLDDYVTRLAIKRLQRTDIINRMAYAVSNPVDAAAAAQNNETEREERLDGRYGEAAAGVTTRSGLNEIGASPNPQIGAGDMATLPPVLRKIVGPDAATRWAALTIRERREVVAWLMVVIVDPTGRGKRLDPARLDHSSWRGDTFAWRGHGSTSDRKP